MNDFGKIFEKLKEKRYRPRVRVIGQSSPVVTALICLAITLLVGAVYFYVALPAINLRNRGLYTLLIGLSALYVVLMTVFGHSEPVYGSTKSKIIRYTFRRPVAAVIIILSVAALIVGSFIGFPLYRAKDYSNILTL